MKKFKIGVLVVLAIVVLTTGIYIKKQWLDDGSVLTTPVVSADKVTRLSAAGGDLRLYEFTPQTAKYMQCVFIAGTNKGSVFCFKKEPVSVTEKAE